MKLDTVYKKKYLFLLSQMKRINSLDYSFDRMHNASEVSDEALKTVKRIGKLKRGAK